MAKSTSKVFKEDNDNKLAKALNKAVDEEVKQMSDEMASEEEKKEEVTAPAVTEPDEDIQDVEIKAVRKQRFRFNHDNSMILDLNTSDLGVFARLRTSYDKLNKLMDEVGDLLSNMPDDGDENEEAKMDRLSEALDKLDSNMRHEVDYIFDAPVSDTLCRDGSMYDPIDGMFRYEHIIDKISDLYENNLSREFGKMRERVEHRTGKYTKKYHK